MVNTLRGMKDLLPKESAIFEKFLSVAVEVAENYGFGKISTPILEEVALFKRSVGENTDIVGKEMYEFVDKGENHVCMRPEGTAGVVRMFVEQKLDRAGGVHRYHYFGPMFRYERPQKGRLRQFHQFGVEVFGEPSVYEDANIIAMAKDIFDKLGIKSVLKLNSLGCDECAPPYRQKLIGFLRTIEGELCDDCKRRIETNPMRVLDCKNPNCQKMLTPAPKITDNLCNTCNAEFDTLQTTLKSFEVEFEIDKNLVRGLDYYCKTAFEFTADTGGSQNAIAGGGRYDKLVEMLDGKPTPAVGFAVGIERIADLIALPPQQREGYYFGAMCEEALPVVLKAAKQLRATDKVAVEYKPKSLAKHLQSADKQNALFCCVIGEDELSSGAVWTKNLLTKEEKTLDLSHFLLNL